MPVNYDEHFNRLEADGNREIVAAAADEPSLILEKAKRAEGLKKAAQKANEEDSVQSSNEDESLGLSSEFSTGVNSVETGSEEAASEFIVSTSGVEDTLPPLLSLPEQQPPATQEQDATQEASVTAAPPEEAAEDPETPPVATEEPEATSEPQLDEAMAKELSGPLEGDELEDPLPAASEPANEEPIEAVVSVAEQGMQDSLAGELDGPASFETDSQDVGAELDGVASFEAASQDSEVELAPLASPSEVDVQQQDDSFSLSAESQEEEATVTDLEQLQPEAVSEPQDPIEVERAVQEPFDGKDFESEPLVRDTGLSDTVSPQVEVAKPESPPTPVPSPVMEAANRAMASQEEIEKTPERGSKESVRQARLNLKSQRKAGISPVAAQAEARRKRALEGMSPEEQKEFLAKGGQGSVPSFLSGGYNIVNETPQNFQNFDEQTKADRASDSVHGVDAVASELVGTLGSMTSALLFLQNELNKINAILDRSFG